MPIIVSLTESWNRRTLEEKLVKSQIIKKEKSEVCLIVNVSFLVVTNIQWEKLGEGSLETILSLHLF